MKLLVAGAGGHGRVVADAARRTGTYAVVAFLDDLYPEVKASGSWPIVGRLSDMHLHIAEFDSFVAAFGDAHRRLAMLDQAETRGFRLTSIVHPAAMVADNVGIGAGAVVLAGAVVNVGAVIGRGVIINSGAIVEHDCQIESGAHVCPGARLAGEVVIGNGSWIGIGASIIQGIRIGANATVGAGAACIRDVGDGMVVVGVPAREMVR